MSGKLPDPDRIEDLDPLAREVVGRLRAGESAGSADPANELVDLPASLLTALLTRPDDWGLPEGIIRLQGARFTGGVQAAFHRFHRPLFLYGCLFDEPIEAPALEAEMLHLRACTFPGISAAALRVRGDVRLTDNLVSGAVDLKRAQVGGSFEIAGGSYRGDARALDLSRASIDADVSMGSTAASPLEVDGMVLLSGATVGGSLVCLDATLRNPGGIAMDASGARVDGWTAFVTGARGPFSAVGAVLLTTARLGNLAFAEARFENPGGQAITADAVTITGGVVSPITAPRRLTACGGVRFPGATVGGDFDLSGASIDNDAGTALDLGRAKIGGDCVLRSNEAGRFEARGEVHLLGAHIAGQLDCEGALLDNPAGKALNLEAASIGQSVFFTSGEDHPFATKGTVHMPHARVELFLECTGAAFSGGSGYAFRAQRAHVAGGIHWRRVAVQGDVDFSFSRCGLLVDPGMPFDGAPNLDNFLYDSLVPLKRAKERLGWLESQRAYSPSSYEQLIVSYRRTGHHSDARRVARAKQERERAELRGPERWWNWFVGRFVGHGYQPWRAGLVLAAIVVIGWVLFGDAFARGAMDATGGEVPDPEPVMYALDVALPIVDFHQNFWIPDPHAPRGELYRAWYWFTIGAGWLLTTLFIGGISGLLKKD